MKNLNAYKMEKNILFLNLPTHHFRWGFVMFLSFMDFYCWFYQVFFHAKLINCLFVCEKKAFNRSKIEKTSFTYTKVILKRWWYSSPNIAICNQNENYFMRDKRCVHRTKKTSKSFTIRFSVFFSSNLWSINDSRFIVNQ